MSKHEKYTRLKRQIGLCLITGVALFSAAPMAFAATSVIANNTLPSGGKFVHGNGSITRPNDLQMNVVQNEHNAVIKWEDFSVGGSATVNFNGPDAKYNTLNYVNTGNISQIYGTINANNNGNIYIVNPAGVQIGNSAQINVGSLYVSTKYLDESKFNQFNGNLSALYDTSKMPSNAELMSLGNINATNVTFEGDGRIVIDTERLKDTSGHDKLTADKIIVNTGDTSKLIVGYDAYDKTNGSYAGKNNTDAIATVSGKKFTKQNGYMWVEDVDQLQSINTNLGGNYALRNSIDATGTAASGFNPIGLDSNTGKVNVENGNYGFYGKFDGMDYNIFGLTIKQPDEVNVGLFGVAHNATINNVTLVSGSITGGSVVGSVVGAAIGNTHISNATNSAAVTGNTDVGGIVGYTGNEIDNVGNSNASQTVTTNATFENLINTGTIRSNGSADNNSGTISNVGGLIGYMYNGRLYGNSYNLGNVSGDGYNVGGLVGHAVNSTIGDGKKLVYNRLDVTGAYNVGGIVGNMKNSTVQNAENSGNVTATDSIKEQYKYHKGKIDDTDSNISDDQNKPVIKDNNVQKDVQVANVGGIVGNSLNGTINDVLNEGDISTVQNIINNDTYYIAGNVGGVVGRAEDTNITNATNKEANIRGAHNVGGIAGYFGSSDDAAEEYAVTNGINNGGDILATSARDANGNVVNELVRGDSTSENFNIGNIGGIVGYMYGDKTHITGSANRGTVHSADIDDFKDIKDSSKAANVGGIVGKIDRSETNELENIKGTDDGGKEVLITENIAVSHSYNTGDVKGFTGIGGVVGMMYNGEVAGLYNLGAIESTRIASDEANSKDPLNMGGVIGDATERAGASVLIYDVYNKGRIGRDDFETYGRHVGGVVGRLSGTIEKAYNNGTIYNGYTTTGGIVGWWVDGSITNVFNTGNITVYDKSMNTGTSSQVGGIAGAVELGTTTLSNAYNLGTLRSIKSGDTGNSLGGIIGDIRDFYFQGDGNLTIKNVYTMGNLYVDSGNIGSIIGKNDYGRVDKINTYYIKPEDGRGFTDLETMNKDNSNKAINFEARAKGEQYGDLFIGNDWRIYESTEDDGTKGTTPILNAFMPNSSEYFNDPETDLNTIGLSSKDQIQYGTAYDPLLTIIKDVTGDLNLNWNDMGIEDDGGLAVFGKNQNNNYTLILDDFVNKSSVGFFGGTIYTGGDLVIDGIEAKDNERTDIKFGSTSDIYASSVTITNGDGDLEFYGNVTATGENGNQGNITIEGDDVSVYGELHSAQKDKHTVISGVEDGSFKHELGNILEGTDRVEATKEHIKNEEIHLVEVSDIYSHVTNAAQHDGNITITANNGDANIYYGNEEKGIVDTAGNLTVNAGKGNVYIDSDMIIGGDLNATANDEIVVDISNVGKVDNSQTVHEFLHDFDKEVENTGTFNLISDTDSAKITVDLWDSEKGQYNFNKYDTDGHTLTSEFNNLKVTTKDKVQNIVYIWVADGKQLKDIQQAANDNGTDGRNSGILDYNFALKNDINASYVDNYKSIGGDTGYTGTFDGRGNRIIGLNVESSGNSGNAGIFDTVGEGGTVKDVNIYSGNFNGKGNAGAVAGVNNGGTIENVTTFGNTVTIQDGSGTVGGIVGQNSGTVDDVEAIGSVIANGGVAGGLVGTNAGKINNSYSNSAVTSGTSGTGASGNGLGGVVGVNDGEVTLVDSLGVTNGANSSQVGGIIGINKGKMYSGYNESIVSGQDDVGGIIGVNGDANTVENVVNATSVDGNNYVGGLVGSNGGSVTNGRNNGEINGHHYVGGLVGSNASADSVLTNLVNDSSASITGENFVGGLAGTNAGKITADEQETLVNRGDITGQNYVGGVAGENIGTIEYVKNDVTLHVADENQDAQFFGGVAGINGRVDDPSTLENEAATGKITNATNRGDVIAENADYVGGIVGWNTAKGVLRGTGHSNEASVEGQNYVGGVAGLNDAAITGTAEEMVGITNSGVVIAHGGGAGGIFGVNAGKIEYAHISNTGIVSGTDSKDSATAGTGGLIGVNKGDIIHSSLTNELSGQVMGTQNVGGLIGINTDKVSGGRDAADSYYKYQVYNNGVVNAGTWHDSDGDGIVDEGEFAVVQNGQNIGGLVGTNNGAITAAYNTGVVNGNGSTNVGGIAGTNRGTIDQVFNTIFDSNGKDGMVNGGTNVGGLVGWNAGVLSNAYNTSQVDGVSAVGNLVGQNNSTVKNVYATVTGKLIGNGSLAQNGYVAEDTQEWKNHGSYDGFDFDNDGGRIWKNYDGYGTPLLKVFLTKAFYDPATGQLVSAADGFNAHYNAEEGLIFHGMGTESNYLWSEQIRFGNGNPNWLGYDLVAMPDIPAWEFPGGRWDYLYSDAPFDRNRDFRERKAEINFVDGGMEL